MVLGNPAAFNGLYALKSSGGRFSSYKTAAFAPGFDSLRVISGPMALELESVEMWCKAVLGKEPWLRDPTTVPIPWRDIKLDEKLCFGELPNDRVD